MRHVNEFLQHITLPVMPEVAHQLILTLNDNHAALSDLQALVAQDPTLTTKVLRLANSAGVGMQQQVSSLEHALALLGTDQVRALAISACMNVAFPVAEGFDRREFWKNCMSCAGYAHWMAEELGHEADNAWLCGMMLRLGELLIASHEPQTLAVIERQPQLPGQRWSREASVLGFTEAQVMAELAHRWSFPLAIVEGLRHANNPLVLNTLHPLSGVVHLGSWLADMPFCAPEVIDLLPAELIERLGLDPEWMRDNLPQPEEFFEMAQEADAA
jgi:HD-like signal output (HDOD) protein